VTDVWTTPRTFVAGEIETAAIFNAHLRSNLNAINGFVYKTADQLVTSSAVLVNDTHLLYAISAAGKYVIDVFLYATSAANAAGDLGVGFTFPTGTFYLGGEGPDIGLASGTVQTGQWGSNIAYASGAIFNVYGLSTSVNYIHLHALYVATATGTLQFQWAQQASNASASTLKAGSHMLVKQVA
jgi:hypothetical protein